MAKMNTKDLTILGDLLAAGKIASVIDKRYPLTEAREAFRYLEQKHGRGKLVVTVQP